MILCFRVGNKIDKNLESAETLLHVRVKNLAFEVNLPFATIPLLRKGATISLLREQTTISLLREQATISLLREEATISLLRASHNIVAEIAFHHFCEGSGSLQIQIAFGK